VSLSVDQSSERDLINYFLNFGKDEITESQSKKKQTDDEISLTPLSIVTAKTEKVFTYVIPKLPVDIPTYQALKAKIGQKESSVYLVEESGKRHQEIFLDMLGEGGSKKAVKLKGERALLLPNMGHIRHGYAPAHLYWERVVLEEVRMSEILEQIGLLSLESKRVNIAVTESSEFLIPSYVSETFDSLAETKGCFIIESNNSQGTTWIEKLLDSTEERLNENNWDALTKELIKDIAKICVHDISLSGDSLNVAIVKKPLNQPHPYEVRFFGFDFTSKNHPLEIPLVHDKPTFPENYSTDKITQLVSHFIELVFCSEFDVRSVSSTNVEVQLLFNQLVEKYTNEVVNQMRELIVSEKASQ
jgi:hypothetical protein